MTTGANIFQSADPQDCSEKISSRKENRITSKSNLDWISHHPSHLPPYCQLQLDHRCNKCWQCPCFIWWQTHIPHRKSSKTCGVLNQQEMMAWIWLNTITSCLLSFVCWGGSFFSFFFFFFFLAFPSYISGVHHFWVRFLRMWPFFNPTIKVVTFCLRGWGVSDFQSFSGIHCNLSMNCSFFSNKIKQCLQIIQL